ncbi:UNVERIFIED_CONTAM: hypothetical protein Cloal_3044 [Acetivibrio alkalicellulosi]
MQNLTTKYGLINGVPWIEYYDNGVIKECILNLHNELNTPYGSFVPQYKDDGVRRKYTKSISFHKNGTIKSINLQDPVRVDTQVGSFLVELITFYENGSINKLFPLNGKITGYWTEENEYSLADEYEFKLSFCEFKKKIIGVGFYEDGNLKNLTLWPEDYIELNLPVGQVKGRIGVSLYSDGSLKSYEPFIPTKLKTPIGEIYAYDASAVGINGDSNSVKFNSDGSIKSLVTSTSKISVTDRNSNTKIYEPKLKQNMFNPEVNDIEPLCIEFFDNRVRLGHDVNAEYSIKDVFISISNHPQLLNQGCSSCSNCSGCK